MKNNYDQKKKEFITVTIPIIVMYDKKRTEHQNGMYARTILKLESKTADILRKPANYLPYMKFEYNAKNASEKLKKIFSNIQRCTVADILRKPANYFPYM